MSELAVDDLISVSQAIAILDRVPLQPRRIEVQLHEASGHHLAEAVRADRDCPPFDKALMDGYAIRAGGGEQFAGGGEQFEIIETLMAGQATARAIEGRQAMGIMTGAPVPAGADAVVPVEWTRRQEDQVWINRAVKARNAIAKRGSDYVAGQPLLLEKTHIGAAQIALLASVGKSSVRIFAPPEVAVLCTGDELVDVSAVPTGSQIRNANGPMLSALLTRLGCRVKNLGIVKDDPAQIEEAIETGLRSDALFISGGMSMGAHDYVPGLLKKLGMNLLISKLKIKPGKPFVFATGRSLVFGLPGNPVSGFVCTVVLANRILARLRGTEPMKLLEAKLAEPMKANGAREEYVPGILDAGVVKPLNPNGSADLGTLARGNCLIVRAENAPMAGSGDGVGVVSIG